MSEAIKRNGHRYNNPIDLSARQDMERVILGALRSAINDHGPIDKSLISSATKRTYGALRTHARNQRLSPTTLRRTLTRRPCVLAFSCDPMCEKCCEWLRLVEIGVKPIVILAVEAFIEVIERELKECDDLGEPSCYDELLNFLDAAEEFVLHWAANRLQDYRDCD